MLSDSLYTYGLFLQVLVTTWNTLTVATEIAFLEEILSLTSVSKNGFKGLVIEKKLSLKGNPSLSLFTESKMFLGFLQAVYDPICA